MVPLDRALCLDFGTFEPEGTGYGLESRWYRCVQMVMFEMILGCLRMWCDVHIVLGRGIKGPKDAEGNFR